MKKNCVYSFHVKDREPIQGIFLKEDQDWIHAKWIFTDYIITGDILINKEYLVKTDRGNRDIFKEKVLRASKKISSPHQVPIPLKTKDLFEYLFENSKIFEVYNKEDSKLNLAKIVKLSEKTFQAQLLGTKGLWLEDEFAFVIRYIRMIGVNTDYVNSLVAYNESLNKGNVSG